MGCDFYAYIQIDEPTGGVSTWDLMSDTIVGCKDYDFYAAIAGIRNELGKNPLIAPRGLPSRGPWEILLPPGHSSDARRERLARLRHGSIGVGWLTLSEIVGAMAHVGIKESERAEQVQRLLEVMRSLERGAGKDRVRLVFGFED